MRAALALLVFFTFAACSSVSPAPTAQQIFALPLAANLHDAHFLITESVVSPDAIHTASGEGILTLRPLGIQWSETANPPLAPAIFDFTSIGGNDYSRMDLTLGPSPWHQTHATWVTSNPQQWTLLSHPILRDAPRLNHTPTWHVQANLESAGSTPTVIELWVRQSDGYPLQLITREADDTTFVYHFDRFNTGASIQSPT